MSEDEVIFKNIMSLAEDLGLSYNTKRKDASEEDVLRMLMTKSLLVMEELDDFRTTLNQYAIDNGHGDIFTVTGLDSAYKVDTSPILEEESKLNTQVCLKNKDLIDFAKENYLIKCRVYFVDGGGLISKINYLGGDFTLTEVGFQLTEKRRFLASEIKSIEVVK